MCREYIVYISKSETESVFASSISINENGDLLFLNTFDKIIQAYARGSWKVVARP